MEHKDSILRRINEELITAMDKEELNLDDDKAIPFWKALLFLLDKYNSEEFFGIINFKLQGTTCYDPEVSKQTFRLNCEYSDVDK